MASIDRGRRCGLCGDETVRTMVNGHYSSGLHGMQAQIDQLTQQQVALQSQLAAESAPFQMSKMWLAVGAIVLVGFVALKK